MVLVIQNHSSIHKHIQDNPHCQANNHATKIRLSNHHCSQLTANQTIANEIIQSVKKRGSEWVNNHCADIRCNNIKSKQQRKKDRNKHSHDGRWND